MAKFKYVGDPNDKFSGPETATAAGTTFYKGEVVDVQDKTDEEKAAVKKLQGNSHFVDMSDKDVADDIAARQKALEKAEADRAKAADEQRKRDEADEKKRQDHLKKALAAHKPGDVTSENAPRPPGLVTRDNTNDPFHGRTVEQRTPAEDHTKAGKTKG